MVKISPQAVYSARFVRVKRSRSRWPSRRQSRGSRDAVSTSSTSWSSASGALSAATTTSFYLLDEAFHQTLSREAGHASAWRFTEEVKAHFDRVRYISMPDGTPLETLVAQHERIVGAIAERDPPPPPSAQSRRTCASS
ncbi:FCD domain-containing protein [Salinicola tamaricis]|uniref:FCD domain-containing protein n=1 Tax=Salinicola tamaricis TaxID=1771309 RepID=UPI000D0A55D8|nr:FCD domain-containing protein [Salinicola tamaricis]